MSGIPIPLGIIGVPFTVTINAGSSGVDLTTATSANLYVTRTYDGTTAVWNASIALGASEGQAVVTYVFQSGDVTELLSMSAETELLSMSAETELLSMAAVTVLLRSG